MHYKLAIVDDESAQIAATRAIVLSWAKAKSYTVSIHEFSSAEELLFRYADEKDFDILLLDIEMRSVSGIELARRIRADNTDVQLVFLTGYPDFMGEGFDVAALHYLLKPINPTKLSEVLDRAVEKLRKTERSLIFSVDGESVRLTVDQIHYAEIFAHYAVLHTAEGTTEVRSTIRELEEVLGDGFVRCHRSYLAGLRYVAKITKTDVILDDGTSLPLSRRLYGEVHQAFISFYRKSNGEGGRDEA